MTGKSVAIIGGGVAGSTAALHLAEIGVNVTLIEKGPSLVSGPPICHLHAGGNLYREISTEQCIELLKQSIDTVRLFPHTLNHRPTVIAIPHSDPGTPDDLIPRLEQIQSAYQSLVDLDDKNQVLGEPSDYYKLYEKADLLKLVGKTQSTNLNSFDEWLIPFANSVNLDDVKYPIVAVQEHGWSVFRLGATAMLALERLDHCKMDLNSEVVDLYKADCGWVVQYNKDGALHEVKADYLINASGYKTGDIDDMVQAPRERLVEFKAAYVTRWESNQYTWPEVIFHGERGTPNGMAQLTPYADNVFQLHGMTKSITLFEGGLVSSTSDSSQPQLPQQLANKLDKGWEKDVMETRTSSAIEYVAKMVPTFSQATCEGTPLFGAQQIPGNDDTLRAADVSFAGDNYARMEIVKGSSALEGVVALVSEWSLVADVDTYQSKTIEELHPVTLSLQAKDIEAKAMQVASERNYPQALAQYFGQSL
ncbi:FAD-dependent oxidoreductase [Vibrio agarivorans]|uniref:FAD-dependent oxidoreductase n=1 Tax=Vibrio agarivorans TaxID=153622 RepID=UPI0022310BDD|nr:FAD-dependent oxidoreductase [Vibrio agarivorans]